MHILDELEARGFIKDVTDADGLRARLNEGPVTFYCGFDPTNTSLTAGNLVPVMLMAHLQRAGHRPIVILGGGTGLVGDPSGKSKTREKVLTPEDVRANMESQRPQFGRFMAMEGDGSGDPTAATMRDNAEWLQENGEPGEPDLLVRVPGWRPLYLDVPSSTRSRGRPARLLALLAHCVRPKRQIRFVYQARSTTPAPLW